MSSPACWVSCSQLDGERGITFLQGRKVVEHGINPNGGDEDGEHDDGQGAEPEPEPPFARGFADDPEEQQKQRRHDDEREAEAFELIAGPTGPGLDGEAIGALNVLAVDVEWERDDGEKENGDGQEHEALEPAAGRDALGPVAQSDGPAPCEDEQQNQDGPGGSPKGEDGAQAGEGDGLGEDRGRQGVCRVRRRRGLRLRGGGLGGRGGGCGLRRWSGRLRRCRECVGCSADEDRGQEENQEPCSRGWMHTRSFLLPKGGSPNFYRGLAFGLPPSRHL